MRKPKTRRFRLEDKLRSTSSDLRSFPKSWSLYHTYTIYDENNNPITHKLSPRKGSTDISTWTEDERSGKTKVTLQRPTFVNGSIICDATGFGAVMAEFIANHPRCKTSKYADPNKITFHEVLPEKTAEEEAALRKLKRKADAVVESMDDETLIGYCKIFGVITKDEDGDFLKRVIMEDNLVKGLDIKEAHQDLLDLAEDDLTHYKLMAAQGLEFGKLNLDKRTASLSFDNGGKFFAGTIGGDIIEEFATWVNSTEEGLAVMNTLEKRLGYEPEYNEEDMDVSSVVSGSPLSELSPKDLFELAKENGVIEHKIGFGYFFKDEPILEGDSGKQCRSSKAVISELKDDENFCNNVIYDLSA